MTLKASQRERESQVLAHCNDGCSQAEEAVLGLGADKYALDDRMRTVEQQQLPEKATKRFINHWKNKAQTATC